MADADEEKECLLPRHHTTEKFSTPTVNSTESLVWKRYGLFIVHLSVIVGQCSFATLNVFGKYGLQYVHPSVLLLLRLWGSVPFFFIAAFTMEKGQFKACLNKKSLLVMGANGVINSAIGQIMYLYGLQLTTATNAATLSLAIPIWTTVVCVACGMEKSSLVKFVGTGLAIVGALIMLEVESFDLSVDTLWGNLLVLGMTILFSLYLVLSKPLVKDLPVLHVNFLTFAIASVSTLPLGLVFRKEWKMLAHIDSQVWLSILMAIVLGTVVPYLLIFWAIKHASPVVVAVYTPMELLATAVLALLFLDEELQLRQLLGAAGILLGLAVNTYIKYKEEREEQRLIEERLSVEKKSLAFQNAL